MSALILFRASLLIAGRKLLNFCPCLFRALRCRKVNPRNVKAVRVIQEAPVDLVRPRLSCGDDPPLKIAE
jgi:hypothetical protein